MKNHKAPEREVQKAPGENVYQSIGPDTECDTDNGVEKLGELSDGARCELLSEDNEEAEMLNEQLRERIEGLEAENKTLKERIERGAESVKVLQTRVYHLQALLVEFLKDEVSVHEGTY